MEPMRAFRTRWIVAAVLAPLAAAACAPGAAAPASAPAPADDFEAIYRARTDSARMRFTEADVQFMHGMIGHHAQAVEISRMAPTHGASPQVRTLAARIINTQMDEIALMQQWLRDRGQPVPELHEMDGRVMVHGATHAHAAGHEMPGMLTREQIDALDAARGGAFDRLFLERMIDHHRGAVVMVRTLFATDGAGQDEDAFRLASDVQVDQVTEVARMELMLSRLPPAGPTP